MKKRRSSLYLIAALALGALVAGGATPGLATTDLREASEASKPEDLQEVGKQLNNPVSSIWNITTQSNMTFLKGELSPAYRGQFTFNFQPVLPIPLTSKWNLIPRPVIPILTSPYISGVNFRAGEAEWSRAGGIGDMAFVALLSPNIPRTIIGFGPTSSSPPPPTTTSGRGRSR
jgi:hypothetical protein